MSSSSMPAATDPNSEDILYPQMLPFLAVHLACLGAIWTGVRWVDLAIALGLYLIRMFAITAGYHRLFSHRSYKTGRVMAFILGFLAQSSAQRGVLWWAAKHRHHHRWSDTAQDVHSPRHKGFWYAHLGWVFTKRHDVPDLSVVPDLTRWPELRWLERHPYLPATVMAIGAWLATGWGGLVVGFFWSTVATWHATFCINSLAHVHGRRRYLTGDDSRNNWWFALLTLGEGWHNNHHAYQSAARQGFRWWEVDITYYVLKLLSWVGLVRDLHQPPASVVRGETRLGSAIIEKAANQLAASFHVEQIAAQVTEMLARTPTLEQLRHELREALHNAQTRAQTRATALLAAAHLPSALPSREEILDRAQRMFVRTPSMDDIVERARTLVIEAVCARLAAA